MKKIIAALLIAVFVPAIPCLAFAEGTAHTIGEYDISLVIPEGYRLITPDIAEDDPILSVYGLTAQDVQDMFDLMPLYLDAVKEDGVGEITVTIQDSTMPDYAELGMTMLEALLPELTGTFEEMGITVASTDTYAHAQMPFTRTWFENAYVMGDGIQYYTVWGGKSYSFAMHSYDGAITAQDEAVMEELIDSVYFAGYVPKALPESEPFAYEDKENGISFTVPAGWQQAETERSKGIVSAGFTSLEDPACNLVYTAVDIWREFSVIDRIVTKREDVDNYYFTKDYIAERFEVSPDDLENIVTINSIEYFGMDYSQTIDVENGLQVTLHTTCFLCIRNARLYTFFYTGSMNSGLYADFEALMASVVYS